MQKLSKKVIIATTIITLVILVGIIAISVAVWNINHVQTGSNSYTYDCFNVTFTENNNGISEVKGYPVSDATGMKSTPYTFTIKNTCQIPATYDVIINKLSTSTLSEAYVKVGYDNNVYRLSELKNSEIKTDDATLGKVLANGVLDAGTSKSFSLYVWIDEKTEIEQKDKTFAFKVSLSATAGENIDEDTRTTLAQKIIDTNKLQTSTPDFAYGAPNTSLTSNASGRFAASDDLGTSYYLRGNITNNYVKFGEYIWRVVRINGDGTIRLITDENIGTTAFNDVSPDDKKYVGYTYDNTYDEDGIVIRGTDSTIKTYVDNWYNENIVNNNLDGYVVEEFFCNDTTTALDVGNGSTWYGSYGRNYKTSGNAPILTCPVTDKSYGGKYKLKVGLLSADEMAMAGLGYFSSNFYATTSNYLFYNLNVNNSFYSLSPFVASTATASIYMGSYGYIGSITIISGSYVRPVINLRSDIKVTAGNGTMSAPYEVAY